MTTDRILYGHVIDGQNVPGSGARLLDIHEPATGAVTARVDCADAATIEAAIASAQAAFPAWAALTPQRRARVLTRFLMILEDRKDELAKVLAREHGKTVTDALGEIQRGYEAVEFACGIPHLLKGESSPGVGPGIDTVSQREPLGVVAGITPFNFPAMIPMWMFGVAVATGNCFILKPSERDPGVPMMLSEWMLEAGAPAGVLSCLNGDRQVVEALLDDKRVKAISFVGSSDIAEAVYARGALNGKRVQAMGGAKNHLVVAPDANMDTVVNALLGAAYGSAGERCMAISVVVPIGDETARRLITALKPRVEALNVGPSTDPKSDFGPLISSAHRSRVLQYIEDGLAAGAELLVDGRDISVEGHADGFYLGPCLFDRVTEDMRIYQEEIFGPVLCVTRAQSLEEAIALPSKHPYGNGVAIFTDSGGMAREFAQKVNTGMVGVNVPLPVPLSFYSFGGWKRSAYGGFNQHGMDGVRFYTQTKTIISRWPDAPLGAEFTMPIVR
ncbi:MAG: CoA-acylating methylmalonate-semialdehyde dehydrogenase [Oceanipulchritudo sp.]